MQVQESLFPILRTTVYDRPLIYLDNAATTQKPQSVIDVLNAYYTSLNSNIHRGTHYLATAATERFEEVRRKVCAFINAADRGEVVFTRGTTESINLVASSFGERFIGEGDEVIVSAMEHHSDMVPWQLVCGRKGAKVKYIPFSDEGVLDLEAYKKLFTERTRIVAVNHVSNTLGTVNPVEEIIKIAHSHDVPVLIDGAQAVAHIPIDVQALDCDFYCFSGHKMYAPMGVGVMYGKRRWLEEMPPYQGGGEMIKDVTLEGTTYNELPFKFEAGTPSVGDVLGLGAAIDFMLSVGVETIGRHEMELHDYAVERMRDIEGMRFIGTAPHKAAVISFLIGDAHPYDVGTLLDKLGVAVRTGHHCTQPIMDRYGIPGTVRASFAVYNTRADVDAFINALNRIAPMLS
ncbi:MAG: cysteine desulfurase [Bacteroidales bacterium]|nr:cysteine desulfurase [Bacteroidales bacterium]